MQNEVPFVSKQIDGCMVKLTFAEKPVEGVIEKVQSILSNAYDERVKNELMNIVS